MCSKDRIQEVACDIVTGLHQFHAPVTYQNPGELVEILKLHPRTTARQIVAALEMLRTTEPHATVRHIEQPGRGTEISLYDLVLA